MKHLLASLTVILAPGVFAAEVYRSVDENGMVTYSDVPTGAPDTEVVDVGSGGRPVSAPAAASSTEASETQEGAFSNPVAAQIPREATPEELAADRARNCQYARQMDETYSTAHRLYSNGPEGERVYLSDDEITAKRNQAKADVATWCD